jgi:uncharacterized membrane protein YhaH (DUF805 family)
MSGGTVILILFALLYLGSYAALFAYVSRQIQDRQLSEFWYVFALIHPIWALMLMPGGD